METERPVRVHEFSVRQTRQMTTLGLDTGFCALWPVATAAQRCRQLNYQPFHRDLDGLMAFCKERKPKFDAGLIFETSVIYWQGKWETNLSRPGTGNFYDIVWSCLVLDRKLRMRK